MRHTAAVLLAGGWAALVGLVGLVGPATAVTVTLAITDVTTLQNADGEGRVLFRLDDSGLPSSVAISRAILTVPVIGAPAARRLDLRLFAVSREWSAGAESWDGGWERGAGGLHDRLYAISELDLGRGPGRLTFDVTSLLKYEKEDGESIHGFLLTLNDRLGDGLPPGDVNRFSRLHEATLEVSYRRVPPRARRSAG